MGKEEWSGIMRYELHVKGGSSLCGKCWCFAGERRLCLFLLRWVVDCGKSSRVGLQRWVRG